MECLIVVSLATIILGMITGSVYLKTRNPGFVVGSGFIYFWSLYGGWWIISDTLSRRETGHYRYLYEKLFPIYLDEMYCWTLILYFLFAAAVMGSAWLVSVRPASEWIRRRAEMRMRHGVVLVVCGGAGIASFLIVQDSLSSAFELGVTAYSATRAPGAVGQLFAVHQVLNRVALLPLAMGLSVLASGKSARLIGSRGKGGKKWLAGYLLILLPMVSFCLILGNKNELLVALVTGVGFYLVNAHRPRIATCVIAGFLGLIAVALVDFVRALPLLSIFEEFLSLRDVVGSLGVLYKSNEAFGAHFSLYGILQYDIPVTYGYSVLSLVLSIIPRIVWPGRPLDIYYHYAEGVKAVQGQGYSLHHAAGWYLNFGLIGIMIGGCLLGGIWGALNNRLFRGSTGGSHWQRVFSAVGFWTFTANIPNVVRAGPEAYKGVLIDAILIPTLVIGAATLRLGLRERPLGEVVGQSREIQNG